MLADAKKAESLSAAGGGCSGKGTSAISGEGGHDMGGDLLDSGAATPLSRGLVTRGLRGSEPPHAGWTSVICLFLSLLTRSASS